MLNWKKHLKWQKFDIVIAVFINGVILCLWAATSIGPIVHPHTIYESGDPEWNDGDREELGENPVPFKSHMNPSLSGERPVTSR